MGLAVAIVIVILIIGILLLARRQDIGLDPDSVATEVQTRAINTIRSCKWDHVLDRIQILPEPMYHCHSESDILHYERIVYIQLISKSRDLGLFPINGSANSTEQEPFLDLWLRVVQVMPELDGK